MNIVNFKQLKTAIIIFIALTLVISIVLNIYLLTVVSIITGLLFLPIAKRKNRLIYDEREIAIREKSAQIAYAIFTPTIGIGAFILLIPYKKISPVFAKGEFAYLESIGMILAYLTLLLITLYTISYHFYNKKFGGGRNEK